MMQFRRYEEDEEGVTLHFDNGQPSVRAKLLVGADGYFSRVRKQCLNDGPPMFTVSALTLTALIALSFCRACSLDVRVRLSGAHTVTVVTQNCLFRPMQAV